MEGLAVMGFVFGMVGVVALVRLEKLTKTLKQKGILEEDCRHLSLHHRGEVEPLMVPECSQNRTT